jgi:hypothetical protein
LLVLVPANLTPASLSDGRKVSIGGSQPGE